MEVFIRDEMFKTCYDCELNVNMDSFGAKDCPNICGLTGDELDDKQFKKRHKNCPLRSLYLHDIGIRADERKKVVAELEEWVEKNKTLVVWGTNNHNNFERIKYFDLQQKLNEMKGGKDE